jgi:hypothetical protein
MEDFLFTQGDFKDFGQKAGLTGIALRMYVKFLLDRQSFGSMHSARQVGVPVYYAQALAEKFLDGEGF